MHFKHRHQRHMRGPGRHGEFWGDRHGGGEGWGRHRRGGGARMFEQGAIKLLVLSLIKEQPRHGYEIIKVIEERMGGVYAPSPGVIYPLLNLLEETGLIAQAESDGAKKLFAITPEGEAELEANKGYFDGITARMDAMRERGAGERAPQIVRAVQNLRMALRLRTERGNLSEEQTQAIAAALDAAAQTIERT